MKENDNPNVCPCCGQSVARTKYYCKEQWAKDYDLKLEEAGHIDPEPYLNNIGYRIDDDGRSLQRYKDLCLKLIIGLSGWHKSDWIFGGLDLQGNIIKLPKPKVLLLWEKQNPKPEIGRFDLTIQLAERVERLEALLREKGGQ